MFGSINSRVFTGKGRPGYVPGGAQEPGQDAGAPLMGVRKVLIVDDEADVADLAEVLLSAHGMDTMVAYSGADALAMLAAHPDIDAVVSDVMMPGMTGIELADQVNERYPKVKIVLASGYMAPSLFADRPLRQLFIAKPYRIDQLLKLLRT
ncbi:response regulator [Massilia yuzhufengensis]|uniref:Response regulator receiver domain-containing protein n=1 Tax=Massilia yuzhufengensis TaxID=1164594 RepID=A0A1I1WCG0_9BURK|nr:response regulator [Massilia yuzhufengensis]SFD92834.1 Response regulator receiver domain-containing protein [Massilia yuzhufengensis]